ncbi:MAG TPA: hypothetical protein VIL18_11085 [Longimicrobiales bacterium]
MPETALLVAPAAGEIRLTPPVALGHARVEVDGVAYLMKSSGVLRVLAPVSSPMGAEIVLLVRRWAAASGPARRTPLRRPVDAPDGTEAML